jgi:hypothetical protein
VKYLEKCCLILYHARWRVRNNNELRKLIEENIVKYEYIQGQRMKWWRRLNSMEDMKLVKNVTVWKTIEVRTEGRGQKIDGEMK